MILKPTTFPADLVQTDTQTYSIVTFGPYIIMPWFKCWLERETKFIS